MLLSGVSNNGLAYRIIGEEEAPSIVLIHGSGLSMEDWPSSFLEKIVALGYRVIIFDHRGIGGSRPDPQYPFWLTWWRFFFAATIKAEIPIDRYTTFDIAGGVADLLDELGIHEVHILGFSMGGMVSQIIASSSRRKILSLTLISTTNQGKAAPTMRVSTVIIMGFYHLYFGARDQFKKIIWGTTEAIEQRYGKYNHLFATVVTGDLSMRGKDITAPTLVIHGKRDPFFQLAHGMAVADGIKQSQLVVIDNMSHSLKRGDVAQIEDRVAQFLSTVKDGRS